MNLPVILEWLFIMLGVVLLSWVSYLIGLHKGMYKCTEIYELGKRDGLSEGKEMGLAAGLETTTEKMMMFARMVCGCLGMPEEITTKAIEAVIEAMKEEAMVGSREELEKLYGEKGDS
jgi:hypothetical protein